MNKWKDGWIRSREFGEMEFQRTFYPKIPAWRGSEFPDLRNVPQKAESLGRNIIKLI